MHTGFAFAAIACGRASSLVSSFSSNRTSVHSGDEVFVRTADGHNMIKVLNYTREGGYQFTSINQDHRPITLPQSAVLKVEYVAGILKASRHVEDEEVNHKMV